MSLSSTELRLLLDEIVPTWQGAQVQKVHMRGRAVLLLSLRLPGQSGVLKVSTEAGQSHLCIEESRGEVDLEASAFCMLLRRLLKGRLVSLEQLDGDRIVEVVGPRGSVVAELTGARACLVALNEDHHVLATSTTTRPRLQRGVAYLPPSKLDREDPPSRFEIGSVNEAIRNHYGESTTLHDIEALRSSIRRALKGQLRRKKRALTKVEGDLSRGKEQGALSRKGELLKLELQKVRRGMTSIVIDDILYGTGEAVEIALDPTLDGPGNLDRIFRKAQKAKRTLAAATVRLDELGREAATLASRLEGLEESTDQGELEKLAADLGIDSERKPRKGREEPRKPYHRFVDAKGKPILVGRSARDNDTLLAEVARPLDLWLHARAETGSHVVVPLDRGEAVDSDRLVDAATLAAHYSSARGEPKVEVSYTPRRYVRKPRGAPPGLVTLQREKVMLLELEPARLERLFRSRARS